MAHTNASQTLLALARKFTRLNTTDPLTQCLAPRLSRTFASVTETPVAELTKQTEVETSSPVSQSTPSSSSRVLTTLYSWPELEPKRFAWYGSQYLDMPLRRDILHRAVIYEADGTRQGTASTKWRGDVHGSNRKIAPQKGMGRARVGDKKSPVRRGGGVAFGPKPRDFSTELPRKIYDIAWRTALSYRYRKGELIVLDNQPSVPEGSTPRLLHNVFEANKWGKGFGGSLLVTDKFEAYPELSDYDDLTGLERLFQNMSEVGEHAKLKDLEDVDVKDLLSAGRVIIDCKALTTLLAAHSADLGNIMSLEGARIFANYEASELGNFVQYSSPPARGLSM